jgi:hypothetical protein
MDEDQIETARRLMPENPYASPQAVDDGTVDLSAVRLRSVARVFKIVGWFGVILYTPIVIASIASLLLTLVGYRIDSLLVLAGASAFNGTILALAILYVLTGRRIAKHDLTARRRAMLLSCVMMIGVPIFTIVGVICYRNINQYLNLDPNSTPGIN